MDPIPLDSLVYIRARVITGPNTGKDDGGYGLHGISEAGGSGLFPRLPHCPTGVDPLQVKATMFEVVKRGPETDYNFNHPGWIPIGSLVYVRCVVEGGPTQEGIYRLRMTGSRRHRKPGGGEIAFAFEHQLVRVPKAGGDVE